MTIDELYERFDDEHLRNMYAIGLIDGEGSEDQRTARICSTVTTAIYNALRMSGKTVPDSLYRSEADYMPGVGTPRRAAPKRQTWSEMKGNLGF